MRDDGDGYGYGYGSESIGTGRLVAMAVGVVLLVIAAALGFAPISHPTSADNTCGALFPTDVESAGCGDPHRNMALVIGALALAGLALVTVGLAGRLRGARLLVAAALVIGAWCAGTAATVRLVHYDRCGSVTSPSEWPGNPGPDGLTAPPGCAEALTTRRLQAGALGLLALGQLGAVAVLVARAPRRRTGPLPVPV